MKEVVVSVNGLKALAELLDEAAGLAEQLSEKLARIHSIKLELEVEAVGANQRVERPNDSFS